MVKARRVAAARREGERGAKGCSRCGTTLPIAEFYIQSRSGYRTSWCRGCFASHSRTKRSAICPCGLIAAASARDIGRSHGVRGATVNAWARAGLVPFVQHGKQIRFCEPEVAASLAARAEADAARAARATQPCSVCGQELDRSRFQPMTETYDGQAGLKQYVYLSSDCRDCRADERMVQRLEKMTGLPQCEIPPALIEAKRAQLMINRLISPKESQR